ncbi:hypothetical protein INT45_003588, partial [Circinella minor]
MDKQMEILDGKNLKGDHTFKIIKLMSKVNGVPVFTALYTALNEYEEIRLQFLVPTKSLSHLQYGFDKLREAYELYGHKQPEIFFTDNVIGDQGFLKSVFPSLLKDVIPVSEPVPIEPLNIPSYPLLQIPKDEVVISCISQYQDIDINLDEFIKKINNQSMQVIGLDCEWPVNQRTKRQGKLSTIQIAGHDTVLVCCVARLDKLPGSLCKLLESDTIVKVGRNVNGDLKKIERDFKIACKGGFELGAFCKSQGAINDGRMGLARICETVLEHTLLKDDDIRLGNWDAPQLSQNQVEYAALDAWASLKIFDEVKRHGIIGTQISKPVEIGTNISFHPGGYVHDAAAYGEIAEQKNKVDDINVKKNKVIVTLKKVVIPGAIVKAHDKCLHDLGSTLPFDVVVRISELRTYKAVSVQQPVIHTSTSVNSLQIPDTTATSTIPDDADLTSSDTKDNDNNELGFVDEDGNSQLINKDIDQASLFYGEQQFNQLDVENQVKDCEDLEPIRSRILKDAFHLMDLIKVSRKHGLSKVFSRAFRDALFVVDEDDKNKVKNVLEKQGTTWEKKLSENPDWVLRRVRRVIPPPSILYPVVKDLFKTYGPLRCARTGRPLFDYENWQQAANVLKAIHQGHVSDPPGIPFYFVKGTDHDGLVLYRCSRGTNSSEGGIHQNIIRRFRSFGASIELTDSALADYRLRHNINVGTVNRYGHVHQGHYDPRITQHINDLQVSLGMPCIDNEPGIHRHTIQLVSSNEYFGISPLSTAMMTKLGIEKATPGIMNPTELNQPTLAKLSTLPPATSLDIATLIMIYSSTLQVPGAQEKEIDFDRFTKIWSLSDVDGVNIFYKTHEHLHSYYNTRWRESENISKTIYNNKEALNNMSCTLKLSTRKRIAPAAQIPYNTIVSHQLPQINNTQQQLYQQQQQQQNNKQESQIQQSVNIMSASLSPRPIASSNLSNHGSIRTKISNLPPIRQKTCSIYYDVKCPGKNNRAKCFKIK